MICVRPPFPPPPLPLSGTASSTTDGTDGSFRYHCTGSTQTFAELVTLELAVDVHPGSAVNPVQPGSSGLIPVAILGSETFDVLDVDAASLRFEGAAPAHDPPSPRR